VLRFLQPSNCNTLSVSVFVSYLDFSFSASVHHRRTFSSIQKRIQNHSSQSSIKLSPESSIICEQHKTSKSNCTCQIYLISQRVWLPRRKSVSNSNNVPSCKCLGQLSSSVMSTTATVPALIVTILRLCVLCRKYETHFVAKTRRFTKTSRSLSLQYIYMLY
jgi:hypothetical protein